MRDLIFTNFIHGYLDTAASRAVGIPAAAVCALLKMDADTDDLDPRICITAEEQGTNRSRQLTVTISARGTVARATTDPWLDAIALRLADHHQLALHLAAQNYSTRLGYQIEHVTPPAAVRVQRTETGPIESAVAITFHLTV